MKTKVENLYSEEVFLFSEEGRLSAVYRRIFKYTEFYWQEKVDDNFITVNDWLSEILEKDYQEYLKVKK